MQKYQVKNGAGSGSLPPIRKNQKSCLKNANPNQINSIKEMGSQIRDFFNKVKNGLDEEYEELMKEEEEE